MKKQLLVRQPGKRVSVSVKGKKKTSDELLWELIPLIKEAEMAQAKEVETLLVEGANVRQKLKDEDTNIEVWYKGKLVCINGNTISIDYEDYKDSFEWTREDLIDDIKNKDLIAE